MEILIGMSCGFFMGTLFTMVWSVVLVSPSRRLTRGPGILTRVPGTMSLALLLPLMVMGGWGIVGGVLGAMFLAAQEAVPGAGIGSPNLVYTIAISLFTINVLVLGALWVRRIAWWEGYGVGLAFAAVFGWLMPWLAE